MHPSTDYRFYPCGDHALTLELGNRIDRQINQQVIALFQFLQDRRLPWIKDLIPSYHTLTVVYDLLQLTGSENKTTAYDQALTLMQQAIAACELKTTASRKVQIPVCYDPVFGPDLSFIADAHGLSVAETIALHLSRSYRVYLLGFLPGFAYMGSVDEKIATPRRSSPRVSVAAGSVGIAGEQTGIYPFESPGGWQLLGRTPLRLFDAHRAQPALLQPGDEVQFYAIDITEFNNLQQHGAMYS
ncbi:MAG: 5-oxoprolinase subunit PxpB [Chitinophagaceae bacterium]|nr:5-oxoprolinase subunit PxpB [Chitinophagaceae bacterium]